MNSIISYLISAIISAFLTWIVTETVEGLKNLKRANEEIINTLVQYIIRTRELKETYIRAVRDSTYNKYLLFKFPFKIFLEKYKLDISTIIITIQSELIKNSNITSVNYKVILQQLESFIKEEGEEEIQMKISQQKEIPPLEGINKKQYLNFLTHPSLFLDAFKKELDIIFLDDFEEFKGWNTYKKGEVNQTKEIAHQGIYSLKKDKFGDPNGGYKLFKKQSHLNLKFSGWIFRPDVQSPNLGDRLALENEEFKGYGFFINHSNNTILIEKRDRGEPTPISQIIYFKAPKDEWYYFELILRKKDNFNLFIYDKNKNILTTVVSYIDKAIGIFDRVVIHGGFPFYVDELKVEKF